MPIPGAFIPITRGTLTFPWGKNRMVVQVQAYQPVDEVSVRTFQGPGRQGYKMTGTNRPDKRVTIRGKYTASDVASQFAMAGLRGAGEIQFGTGEKWAGNFITQKVSGDLIEGNKSGDIEMALEFYGAVTVTPNAAGTNGV